MNKNLQCELNKISERAFPIVKQIVQLNNTIFIQVNSFQFDVLENVTEDLSHIEGVDMDLVCIRPV